MKASVLSLPICCMHTYLLHSYKAKLVCSVCPPLQATKEDMGVSGEARACVCLCCAWLLNTSTPPAAPRPPHLGPDKVADCVLDHIKPAPVAANCQSGNKQVQNDCGGLEAQP